MKGIGLHGAVRDLQTLFDVGALGGLTDGELLGRFVERQEQAVFEAIVRRHGPMVWRVCRRVLPDHHDAEDVFQATFLVLARKASSVGTREKLGNWLHGVAHRTACKARSAVIKRRIRQRPLGEVPEPAAPGWQAVDERIPLLADELGRLPAKYRTPLILCELEGRTHREAANQLGWPIGTVSGRLSRAKAILAKRLSRSGVVVAAGPVSGWLIPDEASACIPPRLVGSTALAATRFAAGAGLAAGVVPAEVILLAKGALRMMSYSRFQSLAWVVIPAALLSYGAIVIAQQGSAVPTTGEAEPRGRATAGSSVSEQPASGRVDVDEELARAVKGRIIQAMEVSKDSMVLSYLPDWMHGNVDNIGIENHDGGVRTLLDWPMVPPEKAGAPDRRYLLALYSRKTTSGAKMGPIQAFRIEEEWPELTSWKTLPSYAPEPSGAYRFEPGDGWKLLDVTALVRARSNPEPAWHGIILRFPNEDANGNGKWSGYQVVSREGAGEWANRRPQLLIVEPPQK